MKLSTQISIGFLIAISIDLLDSYFNYRLTLKVNNDTHFLTQSEVVIRKSAATNKKITDMQSSFRGYLLTSDAHFLADYYNGLRTIPSLLKEEMEAASVPGQREKIDSIELLHRQWVSFADSLIDAKKRSLFDSAANKEYNYLFETQLKKEVGKSYNDQIAQIFNSFDQYEYAVREQRRSTLTRSIRQTERFSLLFSIAMILISTGTAVFLVLKISRRIQRLVSLAENISRGNFSRVNDDKNDELSSLSLSLDTMSSRLSKNISTLQKKNDELDQFAYVVSHDLKAPARGIANVIQWIEEDLSEEISPRMRRYLDIIPERIGRMENLIDGLLEYARIGRDQLLKEWVNVSQLVSDLADVIVPKEYILTYKNLPELYTERLLLQQVLGNLISNAVKYGRGQITISANEKEEYYEFDVSDNGPGIPEQYHERIFVIFQTLREKNDSESTGVGLAIVKKIIEEKHGTIKVVSSPAGGTSFIFTWPKEGV